MRNAEKQSTEINSGAWAILQRPKGRDFLHASPARDGILSCPKKRVSGRIARVRARA